ncbi:hypothetical protein F4780DRAFT_766706 [Xylariomycetidae sp. FL0641]|nr:hypothetical protein F4780DRAFT_766706 [Xylariomycetidae sp. FL0641]
MRFPILPRLTLLPLLTLLPFAANSREHPFFSPDPSKSCTLDVYIFKFEHLHEEFQDLAYMVNLVFADGGYAFPPSQIMSVWQFPKYQAPRFDHDGKDEPWKAEPLTVELRPGEVGESEVVAEIGGEAFFNSEDKEFCGVNTEFGPPTTFLLPGILEVSSCCRGIVF